MEHLFLVLEVMWDQFIRLINTNQFNIIFNLYNNFNPLNHNIFKFISFIRFFF